MLATEKIACKKQRGWEVDWCNHIRNKSRAWEVSEWKLDDTWGIAKTGRIHSTAKRSHLRRQINQRLIPISAINSTCRGANPKERKHLTIIGARRAIKKEHKEQHPLWDQP